MLSEIPRQGALNAVLQQGKQNLLFTRLEKKLLLRIGLTIDARETPIYECTSLDKDETMYAGQLGRSSAMYMLLALPFLTLPYFLSGTKVSFYSLYICEDGEGRTSSSHLEPLYQSLLLTRYSVLL
jgi:hypothetical protein